MHSNRPVSVVCAEPPEGLVWHYTDGYGLLSIISSHTLWSTAASFLNDSGEVSLGASLLLEEMRERAAQEPIYAELSQLVDEGLVDTDGPSPGTTFILSAAQHHDLLAMWRNYGGRGESYAIGLDPAAPLAILADNPAPDAAAWVRQRGWEPVRYTRESQQCLVDAVFDQMPEELQRARDAHEAGRLRRTASRPTSRSPARRIAKR